MISKKSGTDAGDPPSGAILKRAVAEPSSPPTGDPEEEPEYEIVDLIYERTGTLAFPCPLRIVESSERAAEAAGAAPEAQGVPSVGSESATWSSFGHLVRDLRAASAGKPGVSLLATVGVGEGGPASAVKRREPSMPPVLTEAKASSRPGPSSVLANPVLSKVAQPLVASPLPPGPRDDDPIRRLEAFNAFKARTLGRLPSPKRSAKPSRLVKQHARPLHVFDDGLPIRLTKSSAMVITSAPSFSQRLLAEVQRTPIAQRIAAVGVVAAAVVVAAVGVAASALVPGRVPQEAAARSSVAAVVAERAPGSPPAHVERRVPAVVAKAPPEPPNAMLTSETPLSAPEETLPQPSPRRAPASRVGQGNPLHSKPRTPTRPRPAAPCDCFPGDPLCGCLN